MPLLIIKNISREGPGILQELLAEKNISHAIIDLDAGDRLPDPVNYSAIIVLGGPNSANDTTGRMKAELAMVKRSVEAGLPYLGVCLGMQVLVKACGGFVHANAVKEIGFRGTDGYYYTVDIAQEHADDPLFEGLGSPLNIFQLHRETVALTETMQLLATGKYCRHQIVKVGTNAYGIQGHFELTPEMLVNWLNSDPDLMQENRGALLRDSKMIADEYRSTGRKLFGNFLKIAGLL